MCFVEAIGGKWAQRSPFGDRGALRRGSGGVTRRKDRLVLLPSVDLDIESLEITVGARYAFHLHFGSGAEVGESVEPFKLGLGIDIDQGGETLDGEDTTQDVRAYHSSFHVHLGAIRNRR